ncbi:hypothetical protein SISSUDRAFT_1031458 [Sistotremastrum suecicum HHB10207 ss-3]|uniref:Uncharacterized protein n=1 Tax=Sistotremastrum suecicum HHB10207 ss-3 TaxID=1314776 RepID=A0A166FUR2_9AGAM|nr:hypothetical protein SISSUDRAFT_1031458 [Sistotremastrum suecicum HHB10207 ss-3]
MPMNVLNLRIAEQVDPNTPTQDPTHPIPRREIERKSREKRSEAGKSLQNYLKTILSPQKVAQMRGYGDAATVAKQMLENLISDKAEMEKKLVHLEEENSSLRSRLLTAGSTSSSTTDGIATPVADLGPTHVMNAGLTGKNKA